MPNLLDLFLGKKERVFRDGQSSVRTIEPNIFGKTKQQAQAFPQFFRQAIRPPQQEKFITPDAEVRAAFGRAGNVLNKEGNFVENRNKTVFAPPRVESMDAISGPQQPVKPTQPAKTTQKSNVDINPEQYRVSGNFKPAKPPKEYQNLLGSLFDSENASKMAIVMATENGKFDPKAVGENRDGSIDVGLAQINSNTLIDFIRRKPDQVAGIGIASTQDLFDPEKNLRMAKLILEEQGYGAWYGPRDRGFDLTQ